MPIRGQRVLCGAIGMAVFAAVAVCDQPWTRHTIDDSSDGADGVRLADANSDGLSDIATPWEEGGAIRVYLNPGPERAKNPWPAVTVGAVGAPEDAVLVDVDGDGAMDVVSCSEGKTKTVWVHWAPKNAEAYLDAAAWVTEPIPASCNKTQWMWCLPMQLDGKNGVDLVCGAKNKDAAVGWFESPQNPHDLAAWRWHPISPAGWIMSIEPHDVDADGDQDIVFSDRRGPRRGCRWLENPGVGPAQRRPWTSHLMGGADKEVMFLCPLDPGQGPFTGLLAATRGRELLLLSRAAPETVQKQQKWQTQAIPIPSDCGTGKGVAMSDIDLDDRTDLVFSCEHAEDKKGLMWLSTAKEADGVDQPTYHDVSGLEGIKFDLLRLHDLDADGDLDILTCEERAGLGVIWYENPAK